MRKTALLLVLSALIAGPLSAQEAQPPRAAAVVEPVPVTGEADPKLSPLDELMTSFLRENKLPGAALAVARNGKLIYARGFGYADVEQKRPVEPDSLFRIASVSKPLTAAAVMRLVQEGKLTLDTKAFEFLGVQPFLKEGQKVDERLGRITVGDLLTHAGGWDRGRSGDPMFKSRQIAKDLGVASPPGTGDIVRWVAGQPLDFDPASKSVYSNFGYCVLGRVIERAGGMPYEQYVKEQVLGPLGAGGMRLGRTLETERCEGEVVYYAGERLGKPVFDSGPALTRGPYGAWCLESMDAHGGWIGSAPDLVRFGAGIGEAGRLLSEESLEAMWGRPVHESPEAAAFYAAGWMVRPVGNGMNTWHNGSLPGTSTLLVRRHDGLVWAVLFNSREGNPAGKIDGLIHKAVGEVKEWPGENPQGSPAKAAR